MGGGSASGRAGSFAYSTGVQRRGRRRRRPRTRLRVSAQMREQGFDRSPTMCTDKWRTLLKEFKKACSHARSSAAAGGNGSAKMAYYKESTTYSSAKGRRQAGSAAKSPTPTSKIESYLQVCNSRIRSSTAAQSSGTLAINSIQTCWGDQFNLAVTVAINRDRSSCGYRERREKREAMARRKRERKREQENQGQGGREVRRGDLAARRRGHLAGRRRASGCAAAAGQCGEEHGRRDGQESPAAGGCAATAGATGRSRRRLETVLLRRARRAGVARCWRMCCYGRRLEDVLLRRAAMAEGRSLAEGRKTTIGATDIRGTLVLFFLFTWSEKSSSDNYSLRPK